MSEFIDSRFKELAEQWFLTEPAYFALFCTHELRANPNMACPIRTGQGRIEYNPELLAGITHKAAFEELVGIEMLRLFLKHPYERTPDKTPRGAMKAASDAVLTSHYRFSYHLLTQSKDLGLPGGKHYEWYLANIPQPQQGTPGQNMSGNDDEGEPSDTERQEDADGEGEHEDTDKGQPTDGDTQGGEDDADRQGKQEGAAGKDGSGENGEGKGMGEPDAADSTASPSTNHMGGGTPSSTVPQPPAPPTQAEQNAAVAELWEEDEARQLEINELVEAIKDWGSIPGNMAETIIANTRARIDYRKVLSSFRASVLSSERHLTRMKPNRRTGFDYMGSKRDFCTSLLLAVDVSASISSRTLKHFYSVISKFFKYGIQSIDVIQFDCSLQGEPQTFKEAKKMKKIGILGRGGTDFNPVFKYVEENRQYDGLIILTDGYAQPPPRKPRGGTRVAWVCESEESYREHHEWMRKLGKVCYMNLK